VKSVSEDYLKVVVDHASAPKKTKKNIDTGLFKRVFKSKTVIEKGKESVGLTFLVEGEKLNKGQIKTIKANLV
jgi:hypothetical protein